MRPLPGGPNAAGDRLLFPPRGIFDVLFYRLLITLLWPLVAAALLLRVLRGRETGKDWAERIGLTVRTGASDSPVIWLHAASNGELSSVRPVIRALQRTRPDLGWLITCNTVTGRELAQSWGLHAQLAPLDTRWAARRLAVSHNVCALIVTEAEFWPNRITVYRQMGMPVLAVGARISARTARSWGRFPGLVQHVLSQINWLTAQDGGSMQRLEKLGLAHKQIGPVTDLKAQYDPPEMAVPADLSAKFPCADTWLAASTHEGEEEQIIAAHMLAQNSRSELRLILAPRHPSRGDAVASLLAASGLEYDRRSSGQITGAPVLLADTMGEMALWYQLASVTFVGGSLVPKGGHTPYEPAAYDSAIIHGPYLDNFADPYARLAAEGGACQVADADGLARSVIALCGARQLSEMTRAASRALAATEGIETTINAILEWLPPPVNCMETP